MYSYNDRVSYSRIDKDGTLSIANVINAMQDGIMFHISEVGHSALELIKKNRAWMVSSWHVVFKRRPKLDEHFTVDSWTYQMRGTFSSWNYVMKSKSEILAYADAKWFFADRTTGKPARIDDDERNAYEIGEPYDMDYASRKIACPDHFVLQNQIPVSPNYLDTNHHVNNGEYIRLAVNALPINYSVTELRAEYRAAAHKDDIFYIRTAEKDDLFYVALTDEEGSPYFICEFKVEIE